jgi:uncharacterized protein VirK/YbjX
MTIRGAPDAFVRQRRRHVSKCDCWNATGMPDPSASDELAVNYRARDGGGSGGYVRWLWRQYKATREDRGVRGIRYCIRFMREGLRNRAELDAFRFAPADSNIGRAIKTRPSLLDPLARPYQSSDWDTPTRLRKIASHYQTVEQIGRPLNLGPGEEVEILAMPEVSAGLRLVLDEARWFQREGPIVLNLFLGTTRLYSIAFALRRERGVLTAHVGAIQGRDMPGVLEIYRDLTHCAHGMRPRDMTIELFRSLCQHLGVERILLVSDSHRLHRAPYFGKDALKVVTDYDTIWTDRGASRIDASTFELPVPPSRRDLEQVPARKRGQYRKRYAMLDAIEARLGENLAGFDRSNG